jgi:hypothetical protein
MQANTFGPTAAPAARILPVGKLRNENLASTAEAEMAAWARLETDKLTRRKKAIAPSLFVQRDHAKAGLASPGTALLVFAHRGNELLTEVKAAALSGDDAQVHAAGASLRAYFGAHRPGSEEPAVVAGAICAQDVYLEVSYAGKVLADFLTCAKGPLGAVILPYVGGELRPELLAGTAFVSSYEAPEVDVVLVACEPHLSAVERAAVQAVSSDRSEILLGPHDHRVLPGALLTVLLATLAGTACVQVETEMAAVRLADNEVTRLGAKASVDKLLELRKQVLARHR